MVPDLSDSVSGSGGSGDGSGSMVSCTHELLANAASHACILSRHLRGHFQWVAAQDRAGDCGLGTPAPTYFSNYKYVLSQFSPLPLLMVKKKEGRGGSDADFVD